MKIQLLVLGIFLCAIRPALAKIAGSGRRTLEEEVAYYAPPPTPPADYKNPFVGNWQAADVEDGSLLNLFITCRYYNCWITVQDNNLAGCETGMGLIQGEGYIYGNELAGFVTLTCIDKKGNAEEPSDPIHTSWVKDDKNPILVENSLGFTYKYFRISKDCPENSENTDEEY